MEKFKQLLSSRKFWVLIAALIATAAAFFTSEITAWQAVQALIAAIAVYTTGTAIEDAGWARAQAKK